MDLQTQQLVTGVNRAVIKFRGVYSAWSKRHDISYNEMLVFYTIRDEGFCTQKQICDSYLLPRQTMNHVFAKLRADGILQEVPELGQGREKAFVLSEKGTAYAGPLMESLNRLEEKAAKQMGHEKIRAMTDLVQEYDRFLTMALEEE